MDKSLLDKSVQHRGHSETTFTAGRLGDGDSPDGAWSVGACLQFRADLRVVGMEPGTKLGRGHAAGPAAPAFCSTELERPGEVLAGEQAPIERRRGGVEVRSFRRQEETLLLVEAFGLHPNLHSPTTLLGLAAVIVSS